LSGLLSGRTIAQRPAGASVGSKGPPGAPDGLQLSPHRSVPPRALDV